MEKFIAFFEIPAADFHRAVGFYEAVLDIKLAVSEYEEEKMACFMEQGEAVGAVSWAPDFLPSERGTLKAGDISLFLPIAKATISVCIRINSRCE